MLATVQPVLLADLNADAQLNAVVIGLFVLAAVVALTTVVYWRLTRPDRVAEKPGAEND